MADISSFLAEKYRIQQQQADTAQRLGYANADYLGAQTAGLPAEQAARNFAARAGGQASLGQANLYNTNAGLAPWLAGSEVGERNAAADQSRAQAGQIRYDTAFNPDVNQAATDRFYNPSAIGGSQSPVSSQQLGGYNTPGMLDLGRYSSLPGPSYQRPDDRLKPTMTFQGGEGGNDPNVIGGNPLRYDAGTSKVPGQGDGKTDTQQAMLAPGEAVLNVGAAEHLGRGTISLLNAIGAHRMGLTVGSTSQGPGNIQGSTEDDRAKQPGYAMGTENTGPGSAWMMDYPRTTPDTMPSYREGGNLQNTDRATPGMNGVRNDAREMNHYAWGTPSVGGPPGPGQTITSGSWNPAEAAQQAMAGRMPAPPVQPQAASGPVFGKRATPPVAGYAKGTAKVPGKESKPQAKGKMSPHAAAHTPDGGGLSPGIIQALMSMGGMGAPGGGMGAPPPGQPSGPPGLGMPPAGAGMAPVSLPPLGPRRAA